MAYKTSAKRQNLPIAPGDVSWPNNNMFLAESYVIITYC